MIVLGSIKVEHPQPLAHPFALGVAESDLYPVLDQLVLLAIGGSHGLRGGNRDDLADRIVIGRSGQPGIQFFYLGPQGAGQHYLAIRFPAQQAVRPEILVVVGVHRLPAKLLFQVLGSRLLDQGVFGVGGGGHTITSQ